MVKSLFDEVAGLMVSNFFKKKNSGTGVFLYVFRNFTKTYFVEMSEMNQKNCIHKIYSHGIPGDGILFSEVADIRAYSFFEKGLHPRCFSIKIEKFYKTSILHNNAARLLLISCDIFNVLLGINSDKSVQS